MEQRRYWWHGLLVLGAVAGLIGAFPPVSRAQTVGSWGVDGRWFGRLSGQYEYYCDPGGTLGVVWGTDLYTDDSNVCTAGVHAGVITAARGGYVRIDLKPGAASYTGSTRNGVTTKSFGAYTGSFTVAAGAGAASIAWDKNAQQWRGKNGTKIALQCPALPAGRPVPNPGIDGTALYTDGSSICVAAVHSGVIGPSGGPVTVEIRPASTSYLGSTQNGVTSRSYGHYPGGSFTFPSAAISTTLAPTTTGGTPTPTSVVGVALPAGCSLGLGRALSPELSAYDANAGLLSALPQVVPGRYTVYWGESGPSGLTAPVAWEAYGPYDLRAGVRYKAVLLRTGGMQWQESPSELTSMSSPAAMAVVHARNDRGTAKTPKMWWTAAVCPGNVTPPKVPATTVGSGGTPTPTSVVGVALPAGCSWGLGRALSPELSAYDANAGLLSALPQVVPGRYTMYWGESGPSGLTAPVAWEAYGPYDLRAGVRYKAVLLRTGSMQWQESPSELTSMSSPAAMAVVHARNDRGTAKTPKMWWTAVVCPGNVTPGTVAPSVGPIAEVLPGTWKWFVNGDVTFSADGTLVQPAAKLTGKWRVEGDALVITWSHGYTDHLKLVKPGRLEGYGSTDPNATSGGTVWGEKIP